MYAWILGPWFRRLVAGDRGLRADDEKDRISLLEPTLPPTSLSKSATDVYGQRAICDVRVEIYDLEECGTLSWR
jgi:hypothetical protein